MSGRFFKFLVTGGVAALVNLASRFLLNCAMPFEVAVIIAYLIGMTTAYVLSRAIVFDSSGRSVRSEMRRFAIVNAFALILVWTISVYLARVTFPAIGFTWHPDEIAHLVGVLAPAITSYFGHKHFTFASRTHSR